MEENRKLELIKIYREYQEAIGQLLLDPDLDVAEAMELIAQMQQPLQFFMEAYGTDFTRLVEELKKEMH